MKKNKSNNNKKSKYILLLSLFGIVLPILILYGFMTVYYQRHYFNNTVINGINASKMTLEEAKKAINEQVSAYRLNILERNDKSDIIEGRQINLHTEFDNGIVDLLKTQKAWLWPIAIFKDHELTVNTMIEYDEPLLKEAFENLNCLKKENILEPKNATISEYSTEGYKIVPEVQGAKVIKGKLYKVVKNAIDTMQETLSIEEVDSYEKPKITSKEPALNKAIKEMNQLTKAKITYTFGDDTEILDGSRISEWITVDDNFRVEFHEEGVKEFVDNIGKTYNSFGREREFKTSYGDVIKVKGGDYGWWLNRPEEVKELTELIRKGKIQDRVPVYFQTAQQYGKDDIGDTYVEVNLTAQHLFFYKDGKRILESDFVSGNAAKHYDTPTGTYPVQYKQNDATLVGEDYETPVKYWMPFNKNIGFHDAYWRNKFGKDVYLTNGSHGCINMPPKKAEKLFKDIQRGVAVVVYKLKGTETYELKNLKGKASKPDTKKTSSKTASSSSVVNDINE